MRLPRGQKTDHWLPVLQKAYAFMDRAARIGLERMELKHSEEKACRVGCAHCCRGVIPASAPELAGGLWYVAEHCSGSERLQVEHRLYLRPFGECPFLLDEKCLIYPVRFLACRQFFMFGRACAANENVWETRRSDIPTPDLPDKFKALALLSVLYGVEPEKTAHPHYLERFIRDVSPPLHMWDLRDPGVILADLQERRLHYAKSP